MTKPMEKQGLTNKSEQTAVRRVTIGEDDAGCRLDRFLTRRYPEVARSRLFRIVRKGEVRVNGKRAEIDTRLVLGDEVRLPPSGSSARRRALRWRRALLRRRLGPLPAPESLHRSSPR